jgi:hypothetical protein
MLYFHLEVWEGYERPFEEGVDSLPSAEHFVQGDIAIFGILGEKAQKQGSVLSAPSPRPPHDHGVLTARYGRLAHQTVSADAAQYR